MPTFQIISPKLRHDVLHVCADAVSAKDFWAQGGKLLIPDVSDIAHATEASQRMGMMNHLAGEDIVSILGGLMQDPGMSQVGYQVYPTNAKG
jgi:hypothetical protein